MSSVQAAVDQLPGGGTVYPFAGPGPLVGEVVDAYFAYADRPCGRPLPFTLVADGDAYLVRDADGGLAFDSRLAAASTRPWGDRRLVCQFVTASDVLRLVVRRDRPPAGGVRSGVLDPRACNRLPDRVRSFRVGALRLTGQVRFVAGHNVDLQEAAPSGGGVRQTAAVLVDAVPGAGEGRVDGCRGFVPVVRRLNGSGPDCGGSFAVEVDPCFRLGPPLVVSAPPAGGGPPPADPAGPVVRLSGHCRPCYDCDDFVRTYRGLKRQWARWRALAGAAEHVRDVYADNRARWLAVRERLAGNPLRLFAAARPGCLVELAAGFCNVTDCCLTGVEVRLSVRRFYRGVVLPHTVLRVLAATRDDAAYAPEATGPVVRFFFDRVAPRCAAVAKATVRVIACSAEDTLEAAVTAHADDRSVADAARGCDLPARPYPPWLAALWQAVGVPVGPPVRAFFHRAVPLDPGGPAGR